MRTPTPTPTSTPTPNPHPITAPAENVADASSGREYFYNTKTGVTQWEAPAGWKDPAAGGGGGGGAAAGGAAGGRARTATSEEPAGTKRSAGARKSMITRRAGIAKRSTAKPQTVGEKLATRAKKFVQMRKAEKSKSQPSACTYSILLG